MSNVRNMIDAISDDNFDGARSALKASLAEYMAGKKYVSNEDIFGSDYTNPNDEEQDIKAELTESEDGPDYVCPECGNEFDADQTDVINSEDEGQCPNCKFMVAKE
jgi:DNA-directed RNA polymerase subunit RPC12/RpoP